MIAHTAKSIRRVERRCGSLRHYLASLLIADGADVKVVQA